MGFASSTFLNPLEVNWGDGNVEIINSGEYYFSHTYATVGTYQISIKAINGDKMPIWYSSINLDSSQYAYSNRQIVSIDTPFLSWNDYLYPNNFDYGFQNCYNLKSVCEKLFINNPQITSMAGLFQCNSSFKGSLTTLPKDLFAYTPNITDLKYFAEHQGFTSLPNDLFTPLTEVESVYQAFYNCESLQNIPSLATLKKCTNYSYAFGYCDNAVLNENVFGTDYNNQFIGVTSYIDFSFIFCRSTYTNSVIGKAPRLDLFNYPVSVFKSGALDCVASSITNYNEISSEWK